MILIYHKISSMQAGGKRGEVWIQQTEAACEADCYKTVPSMRLAYKLLISKLKANMLCVLDMPKIFTCEKYSRFELTIFLWTLSGCSGNYGRRTDRRTRSSNRTSVTYSKKTPIKRYYSLSRWNRSRCSKTSIIESHKFH